MIFWRSKAKLEAKIEREKARWQSPRTVSGARIGNAEALVYVVVFILTLLLVAIAPKQPMVHLLIFGAAVFALSDAGRRMMIPVVYGVMAAKFGWPGFEDAAAEEGNARRAEKEGEIHKVEPAPGEPQEGSAKAETPALAQDSQEILKTFFSISREDRRPRVEAVITFLGEQGLTFPDVEEGETPEDRIVLAEAALKRLAKQHGLIGGGVA